MSCQFEIVTLGIEILTTKVTRTLATEAATTVAEAVCKMHESGDQTLVGSLYASYRCKNFKILELIDFLYKLREWCTIQTPTYPQRNKKM